MRKKIRFLALCFGAAAVFACAAADLAPSTVVVNGANHAIWVGKGASDSTVVIDSADSPVASIAYCTVAATFTRLAVLKSFVITLAPSDGFAPSGEITLAFPKREPLRLFGKVSEKIGANGGAEYSLAFFTGLGELRDCCLSGRNGAVVALFAQDGQRREIALPGAFFEAMPIGASR